MGKRARLAAWIAAVMTLVVTVVRIVLTPQLQDARTGQFHLGYGIIGLMAAAAAAVVVLTLLDKTTILPTFEGRPLQATGWVLVALGGVLVVTSVYDLYMWMRLGQTPPPNASVTGLPDRLTLLGTLLFGLLAGLFGLRQGWQWIAEGQFTPGRYRLLPLALPLWLWMRLARYVVSYASAVSVTETFYDYAMLIVSLLFAMSLSRYIAGLTNYGSKALLWQALLTVLCGVSDPVTRFVMYLTGETEAYSASALAGFPDLMVALLAGCVAVALLTGRHPAEAVPVSPEDVPASEAQNVLEELAPELPEDTADR